MIRRLLPLLIIALLSTVSKEASAQVNTEAIDAYWTIVDQLKVDREPSPREWEAFFNLPGNRLALKSYKNVKERRDSIRMALQLVYMPGRRGQLQATHVDPFLENILYTRDHEETVKAHVAFLKEGPAVVDSMYQLAYRFLPSHRQKKLKNLKAYYIGPLTHDSRAEEGAFFVNTAAEARYYPKRTVYVGAHELHHLLLRQQQGYKIATDAHARYVAVVFMAKSLHREGIADLIDKKHLLAQEEDTLYRPLIEKRLQQSDSMIRKLNAELERLARTPEEKAEASTLITYAGHAPGQYMGLVIERNGYLPELLQTIHRPFNFLYIYNKAAQKDSGQPPTFSPAALTFLRSVENLFVGAGVW